MFRIKADDYVKAMAWNTLPVAVQHTQIATLFTNDFWLAICQHHEFLNMPENRTHSSRPIEEYDIFVRWADYTHDSSEVVPGARTIATTVWEKINSVADDLTVIQDWIYKWFRRTHGCREDTDQGQVWSHLNLQCCQGAV